MKNIDFAEAALHMVGAYIFAEECALLGKAYGVRDDSGKVLVSGWATPLRAWDAAAVHLGFSWSDVLIARARAWYAATLPGDRRGRTQAPMR